MFRKKKVEPVEPVTLATFYRVHLSYSTNPVFVRDDPSIPFEEYPTGTYMPSSKLYLELKKVTGDSYSYILSENFYGTIEETLAKADKFCKELRELSNMDSFKMTIDVDEFTLPSDIYNQNRSVQ